MNFLETLAARPLVADGAMGTMINARGFGFERSFEALNLLRPEVILDIHREFVAAGADIIETNTFSATSLHLDRWGLSAQAAEINAAGVALARQASTEARSEATARVGRTVFVAGSIGPTGARLAPLGPLSVEEARAAYAAQISVFASAGVDLLVFETFADIAELETAIGVAKELCALPIVASMSFSRELRTTVDVVPETAFQRLLAIGVDVIGANCSTGPRGVFEVLSRFQDAQEARATPDAQISEPLKIPFAAMPNAGYPESRGERLHFPAPPDYFNDYGHRFLDVGARIIGGCCGTTPAHIAGVRRALDEQSAQSARTNVESHSDRTDRTDRTARVDRVDRIVDRTAHVDRTARVDRIVERVTQRELVIAHEEPALAHEEPALAFALRTGTFVKTVEVEPPKSPDTSALEATALMLQRAGATTLNISDTPMARMRMTGLGAAVKVQQATGLETVLHFPVRGRNLLRVQGDLLAAHALGVRTLFVTMGDLASIGDYPQAFDHHDIVPTGLVKLVKQHFNHGVDSAGSSIGQPCSFVAGVAVNLTPSDFDAEAKLLHRKVSFGADYALTQPIFEAARARAFVAHYENRFGKLALPLFVGILPLASVRHAVFLKNEVPGMSVSAEVVARMDRAGDAGRDEGQRIAAEMLADVRDLASGVYFIPAFKRFEVVAELLSSIV